MDDDSGLSPLSSDLLFEHNDISRRWENLDELQNFSTSMQEKWAWAAKDHHGFHRVKNVLNNVSNIPERLSASLKAKDEDKRTSEKNAATESFRIAVNNGLSLLQDEAVCQRVTKYRQKYDEDIAAAFLDCLMGGKSNREQHQNAPQTIFGMWLAHCYQENLHAERTVEINNALSNLSNTLQEKVEIIDSKTRSAEKYFFATKDLFENELALKAPVGYWKSRAFWSLMAAIFWGTLLAFFVATFGLFLWDLIERHLIQGMSQPTTIDDAKYKYVVVMFLVVSGLGGFIIRILSKLFLGSLHIRQEMLMRATMTQTFLSLMEREKAIDAREKEIVLRSIFLPVSSGFVKEDAGSLSPIDMVIENIKRS